MIVFLLSRIALYKYVMLCYVIFKSIAATQFLSNMFIYFFVNGNIFKFHTCCSMYKGVMATLLLLLVKI